MKLLDCQQIVRRALRWATMASAASLGLIITGQAVWALPGTVNLSLNGTATSSQSDFGATESDAIDGNRDGNFGNGSVWYGNPNVENNNLFYQVDLGVDAYIDRVQVLRRTDADQGVFGNMRLTIYDDNGSGSPGNVTFTKDYLTGEFDTGGFEYGTWGTTDPGLTTGGTHGRHVRLERIDPNYWLTFAEFEVIGSTSPLQFTEANNIARGKPVTTSSAPGYGSLITSGNDGLIDGNFGNGGYRPVYHSSVEGVGEYWQVDLGAMTQLDHLQLFSRTDAQTTEQYMVSVLDQSQAVVASFVVDNPPANVPNPVYDQIVNTAGATGQYIRVETTLGNLLAFAELRAFQGPGSVAYEADFDGDGDVDSDDLTQWKGDYGINGDSDSDGDGDSDGHDFLKWQQQYGSGLSPLVAASSVPEPNTVVFVLIGMSLAGCLRRQKQLVA